MQFAESYHHQKTGLVIKPLDTDKTSLPEPGYLLEKLAAHGYIVLRDFEHSISCFSELVRQTSSRISLDPARTFDGDTAQKVDAGYDKIGLHCENGNSPFWPDLCWFYCQDAPAYGSQTTVCDGKQVYDHMSDAQKAIFLEQDIVYTRQVEEQKWQRFAFHALAGQADAPSCIEEIQLDHLLRLTEQSGSSEIRLNEDHSIQYSFRTPAIRKSHVNADEKYNFANSIFGPSTHYEKPVITFTDGTSIPEALLAQMEQLCETFTYEVNWQEGDIVMIDNTRVMHGRRKIEDKNRTIFNALSYL
ncbi:Taurine catabolism dioxygenase TauD, TfdA family [Vibrio aerogenes CECT 7868]|uniref:Taurine catabolism dioxygenase TauD, TfdA family n=1 Tax=Vibrio aerogenes CECT 7868 TaxID=1216006 RepID=A0A1M5ZK33_9VIBR|nr:TauD/TfdA family dioxygenase [Vibrio aerogenes]SHI24586.1 Taurine catabolism dioxygenase TauD, TfdA family [Vibrio aerogenes CECT 7868]